MKSSSLFIITAIVAFHAASGQSNRKPKIVGQQPLSTQEEQNITILMTHLHVEDADDWFYPWGFTMKLYPGSGYSISGDVVTPARDFTGKLVVEVTVHDGEDESNKFNLEITVNPVNDKPVITGHASVSTNENQPFTVATGHLTVTDPDNKYPDDFSLKVHSGGNYTVSGNTVTPQSGFTGTLSVGVSVHDGQLESDVYALPLEVKAVNRVPQITGQVSLQVSEDESITVLLSHLTVVDEDSNYPEGFTLQLSSGNNYAVENTSVRPRADFFGKLTVPVTVNDGKNTSKPFNLSIAVIPVNDNPVVSDLETAPLFYSAAGLAISLSETLTVSDVDGDSIMFAEVGFREGGYQINADKLEYTSASGSPIRGVFDSQTGVLTLVGQASPASYTVALRSVTFQTIAPSAAAKILYLHVNDGKSASETVERALLFGKAVVSLDIPSAFTPNGDMANDTWKIVPLKTEEEYLHARIRVYNKMGIMVYETTGFHNEWDGRLDGELLPADTYFYTIDLNTDTPEGYVKGLVTILR